MQPLVLGSTSPYRRQLLEKLALTFVTAAPDCDERARTGEAPAALVERLSEAKARSVAKQYPNGLIIGSDQVAVLDDSIVGKPHDRAAAMAQLRAASGRTVRFLTGLCLYNAATDRAQRGVEPFSVAFRELEDDEIERYLDREAPYDCAGSFRSEGYGITLARALEGRDPNTLIGLPLIALSAMLRKEGVRLP
jgi:MAF protein